MSSERTPFRAHVTAAGRPKRAFGSRAQAAASLRKRGATGQIYQCDLCENWHVSAQGAKDILRRNDDEEGGQYPRGSS